MVTTVGVGGGSLLLGLLFERGGYGLAYAVAAGLSGVAFCILVAAGALPDANRDAESSAQGR
jgi:predicted MFS family arabinose efflux permease